MRVVWKVCILRVSRYSDLNDYSNNTSWHTFTKVYMNNQYSFCKCAGAALFLLAAGCEKSAPPAQSPPPAAVTVSQPVVRDVVEWDEYQGRMDAVDTVEVSAR